MILFYSKVKAEEKWKKWIFQNYCSLWHDPNLVNKDLWVLKVNVISWTLPKVIFIRKIKLAFLRNHWTIFNQILDVSLLMQVNENLSS